MATLKFSNVNKIYDNNVQAVFDFNLEVQDKEFVVFVGPSGCGKSTTLRMIAGLEDISTGELYIDERLVNYVAPKDRQLAMVFQSYALYPHMTVYRNMSFGLKIRKTLCPLYAYDEEAKALEKQLSLLRKSYKKVSKLLSKAPNDAELIDKEAELRKSLHEGYEKLFARRTPVIGVDQKGIDRCTKQIEKTEKEIANATKLLEKEKGDSEPNQQLIEVIERDIDYKHKEIDHLNEQIATFSTGKEPISVIRHLSPSEIDSQVLSAAEVLDLIKYMERKPAELSGGQRQRVALGRAIVRKPKVFLMDEPLSNLDAKLRVQTRSEIARIHKRVGATTIYVTHDQTEAMTLADRIVIMKDGYIQQIAKPKDAYRYPVNMFVASFIGSPATSFIHGTYANGVFTSKTDEKFSIALDEKTQGMLSSYNGQEVVLGVRPEHVRLSKTGSEETNKITVKDVELLGNELIAYFGVGEDAVSAKFSADDELKADEELFVEFNMEKVHFFDPTTTNRI